MEAAAFSERWKDTPQVSLVLKTAVEAGDTTTSGWASQLTRYGIASEFMELDRGVSLFGQLKPRMRTVPFTASFPREISGSGGASWVGAAEATPTPIKTLSFGTNIALPHCKMNMAVVSTEDLLRFSSVSAETAIRQTLLASIAEFQDTALLDSTIAPVTNINPGAITNGATVVVTTGSSAAQILADLQTMVSALGSWRSPVWIMRPKTACKIQALLGAVVQPSAGMWLLNIPVFTSISSPAQIVLLDAGDVVVADDGEIDEISVSRDGAAEMETTPNVGEQSPTTAISNFKSFWQNNLVGIKIIRRVNFALCHATSCVMMSVAY